jgi:hypothetical protein
MPVYDDSVWTGVMIWIGAGIGDDATNAEGDEAGGGILCDFDEHCRVQGNVAAGAPVALSVKVGRSRGQIIAPW